MNSSKPVSIPGKRPPSLGRRRQSWLGVLQEFLNRFRKGTWAEYSEPAPLHRPFFPETGYCWTLPLPELFALADSTEFNQRSTLVLLENGRELGPSHSVHEMIRQTGRGAYSHWVSNLMFSSSDNSDPNQNGREYSYYLVPPRDHPLFHVSGWDLRNRVLAGIYWVLFLLSLVPTTRRMVQFFLRNRGKTLLGISTTSGDSSVTTGTESNPVNHRRRDNSPAALQKDVAHTLAVTRQYLGGLPGGGEYLKGKTVLEIGPGINLGTALIMAGFGARVFVADRFPCGWEDPYHSPFYSLLLHQIPQEFPGIRTDFLEAFIRNHQVPELEIFPHPLEDLRTVPYHSVDVFLSNAVLEHCQDPWAACREMARVARPGAIASHQVDFRDHRDMSKPLEFLLMSEEDFQKEFALRHGECGNRMRPMEWEATFREHGWRVTRFEPNFFTEESYLKSILPRLQSLAQERFRDLPVSELSILCGRYQLAIS